MYKIWYNRVQMINKKIKDLHFLTEGWAVSMQ